MNHLIEKNKNRKEGRKEGSEGQERWGIKGQEREREEVKGGKEGGRMGGTSLSSLGVCTFAEMPRGRSTLNACKANPVLKTPRGCLFCQHYEGSSLMHRQFFFPLTTWKSYKFFHPTSIIDLKHSSSCIPFFIPQTVLERLACASGTELETR